MIKASFISTKFSPFIYVFLLTLIGTTIGLLDARTVAANEPSDTKQNFTLIFKLPPKGAPGPRTDAGSRDTCPVTPIGLTAIVPGKNAGQTLSDRPTIWAYVPFQGNKKSYLELEIKKARFGTLKVVPLPVPSSPGIIQIPFPSDIPAMKIGDRYIWKLNYTCDISRENAPKFVQGSIDRIKLSTTIQQQLTYSKSVEEKIKIYAENGIWYDLLTVLIIERSKAPQNQTLNRLWTDLMSQEPEINLKELVNETISQ